MDQISGISYNGEWNLKSLYYIAKMKVKQKDFYEAQYILNRLPEEIVNKKINDFRKLIEGVYYILT